MDLFNWLKYHLKCPSNEFDEKKTRKRDKSEIGIDAVPNLDTSRHESNTITSSLNAYYTKHLEKHSKRDQQQQFKQLQLQDENRAQNVQQTITNKLKSKISSVGLSNAKETKSLNSLLNPRKSSLTKRNSKDQIQTRYNQIASSSSIDKKLSSLDLNKNNNNKLATLPLDKKAQANLDNSLISFNCSSRTDSTASSESGGKPFYTSQDILNKVYFTFDNSLTQNNMIMTTGSKTLPYPPTSSVSSSTIYQASPIVQQPQFIQNSSLNMSSTSSLSTPSTPITNNHLNHQPLTPSTNSNKINSLSYLDDGNLKIACIDHNDLAKLIKLQNLIDPNEWLAFNTKMYFDQINVLYGAIAEYCSPQTCPTMSAPANNQFYWLDEKGKKFKYSASQYIDTVLTYIFKIISDEALFPIQHGHAFPSNFESLVKKIHKHLFQILAHMYHSHYKELVHLKLNTYINSIYFHLYLFSKNFNTIEEKDLEVMDALNKSLINKYTDGSSQQQQLLFNQQQPTIHQTSASTSSPSSGGFSFFKKKLNFNLMA